MDTKRKNVLECLFRFLPETEWNIQSRVSKIQLGDSLINHPLEANLWQLAHDTQTDFLESMASPRSVNREPAPTAFADWVTWKFGATIAREYMLPYNRKIWSMDVNALGTYWLEKLPDVSYQQTLESCQAQQAKGRLSAHGQFYYRKNYGYGEVWNCMALSLGNRIRPHTVLHSIDLQTRVINDEIRYKRLLNTIPWPAWNAVAQLPEAIKQSIQALQHTSLDIDYYPESVPTDAHWTYEPNESVAYHRILHRNNFVPDGRV